MLYINPLDTLARGEPLTPEWQKMREKVALEELEHHFAYMLLQEMRKSTGESEFVGNSHARGLYEDMLNDAIARDWAKSGQLGIANLVAEQLARRNGEIQPNSPGSVT